MKPSLFALLVLLCCGVLALPAPALADTADDPKGEAEKTDSAKKSDDREQDLREIVGESKNKVEKILDDMSENMRQIEELLKEKDTSQQTQSRQQKALDQLDQLIEEASKT